MQGRIKSPGDWYHLSALYGHHGTSGFGPSQIRSPRIVELIFTSFNQQSCIYNHSEVITIPPFFQSSQVSLSDAPFLGAQGGDQSLLQIWVVLCLGTSPGALPYPVGIPGELVHPSNEPSWGSTIQRVGTPVRKRTQNTVRWHTF